MKATISILGCGWLGLPLGSYLHQQGYHVKGSVTSKNMFPGLQEAGITPYLLVVSQELGGENLQSFFSCDVLIINFPPERRADIEAYLPAQFRSLIAQIIACKVPKVLLVSSTSVYPNLNREVFEHENLPPDKGSGRALKAVEDMLLAQQGCATTVLRLGGLVGYDRLPGAYLSSKKEVTNADVPLNVIHRDDCIRIAHRLIQQDQWGEVFNACADQHPLRREFYTQAALIAGIEPPVFSSRDSSAYKIVNSEKLKASLGYTFLHPDPLEMLS